MAGRTDDENEQIDRNTSRSILKAVAERLQESFQPERSRPSTRLQRLLDELRRRDEAAGAKRK
jgi:hypothetical protein